MRPDVWCSTTSRAAGVSLGGGRRLSGSPTELGSPDPRGPHLCASFQDANQLGDLSPTPPGPVGKSRERDGAARLESQNLFQLLRQGQDSLGPEITFLNGAEVLVPGPS